MKIKQHIPNACVDPDTKYAESEFNSYEELIEIPWVKHFSDPLRGWKLKGKPDGYILNPFIRFSISDYHPTCDLLMAEYNVLDGWDARFWVVGYLSKDCINKLNLPTWKCPDD